MSRDIIQHKSDCYRLLLDAAGTDAAADTPAEEPAEQTPTVRSLANEVFGSYLRRSPRPVPATT